MDIFFVDPDDTPVPPAEVRIRELNVRPYPDGRRVKVYLELTPFQQRPDAELKITAAEGSLLASVSVIETIDPKMEMTLHLPPNPPDSLCSLQVVVFYRPADDGENGSEIQADILTEQKIQIVDQKEITFDLPELSE
jgi:hypothetical protein